MKRKSKIISAAVDQAQEQAPQPIDEELIEASLELQFEEESNSIVLTDAALTKSEKIKGDQTQEIL